MLPVGRGSNVIVLHENAERDQGRKAQLGNINAAKAVADIIRTTLGPRSMLKMILDPMGGIVLTNDGNAILREIDVNHPAAKSMIELSRTQDDEVGDGTTSVIILAGEMLQVAEPFLERKIHPRTIVWAYNQALNDALEIMKEISVELDINDTEKITQTIRSTIGTKYATTHGELICSLALRAVSTVREVYEDGRVEMDIKRFARVERVPGGDFTDSKVLDGIMLNKDVLHPKMRRRIENPRILCLDAALEYNKGESQTNIEILKENDFEKYLKIEEDYLEDVCKKIIDLGVDVVTTEKGCAELVQHILMKNNISVFRRVRKTDNVRLARASGAKIGSRVSMMTKEHVGAKCGLMEVKQVADETFTFFTDCKDPKACTILLRGGSKDILQEMDRNLQDAMAVSRNLLSAPRILPGGGATEMAVAVALEKRANNIKGVASFPYRGVARALEVIPRTLIQNCGQQPIRVLTELKAKHSTTGDDNNPYANSTFGVDGTKGTIVDMKEYGVWEPFVVKTQTIKTAIESSCMLLRIDDVVSGLRNKDDE